MSALRHKRTFARRRVRIPPRELDRFEIDYQVEFISAPVPGERAGERPTSYKEYKSGFPNLASTPDPPNLEGKSQVGPHACRQYTHQESPFVNSGRLLQCYQKHFDDYPNRRCGNDDLPPGPAEIPCDQCWQGREWIKELREKNC